MASRYPLVVSVTGGDAEPLAEPLVRVANGAAFRVGRSTVAFAAGSLPAARATLDALSDTRHGTRGLSGGGHGSSRHGY